MDDEVKAKFDLSLIESRRAVELAIEDSEINEAVNYAASWGAIAVDKLIASGTPAIYAANMVVATMNTFLLKKLMAPPAD
jgi:hypothetical protein